MQAKKVPTKVLGPFFIGGPEGHRRWTMHVGEKKADELLEKNGPDLEAAMNAHEHEGAYVCECGAGFRTRALLVKHNKTTRTEGN